MPDVESSVEEFQPSQAKQMLHVQSQPSQSSLQEVIKRKGL